MIFCTFGLQLNCVCVHVCVCVCVCGGQKQIKRVCARGQSKNASSSSSVPSSPTNIQLVGNPRPHATFPLVPLSLCFPPPVRLYKPQLTSVRASFDVLIVPFGFYSLSIHTHTHRHVVVVTVCIRHLPFCGQCVLLLMLLLFAYAYLPLNDAAGVVVVAAALYFALPPTLPSTFAFCHCLRLCLYLCLLPLPLPLPSTTAFASTWLHSPFRFRPQFPFPFCTRAHLFAFWWSCCSRCNIGNGPGPETNGTLSLCLSLSYTHK